ncbi:DUF2064 domain-containing protein [Fibrobacterota bacterium]
MDTSAESLLVLFCKRPALNQGKQRLASGVGAGAAFAAAGLMLDCALEDLAAWPGPVAITPSSPTDQKWARGLPLNIDEVVAQPEGNLGERIRGVDNQLRERGYALIIYMGTDLPSVNEEHYRAARELLLEYDVVLSPALDGGVTLMGSSQPWPEMKQLPWGSDQLGRELESVCREAGMTVARLPDSYDIDNMADLKRLLGDLKFDPRPARVKLRSWLADFFDRRITDIQQMSIGDRTV